MDKLCIINGKPCHFLEELSPTYTQCRLLGIILSYNHKRKAWIRTIFCVDDEDYLNELTQEDKDNPCT